MAAVRRSNVLLLSSLIASFGMLAAPVTASAECARCEWGKGCYCPLPGHGGWMDAESGKSHEGHCTSDGGAAPAVVPGGNALETAAGTAGNMAGQLLFKGLQKAFSKKPSSTPAASAPSGGGGIAPDGPDAFEAQQQALRQQAAAEAAAAAERRRFEASHAALVAQLKEVDDGLRPSGSTFFGLGGGPGRAVPDRPAKAPKAATGARGQLKNATTGQSAQSTFDGGSRREDDAIWAEPVEPTAPAGLPAGIQKDPAWIQIQKSKAEHLRAREEAERRLEELRRAKAAGTIDKATGDKMEVVLKQKRSELDSQIAYDEYLEKDRIRTFQPIE